MTVPKIQIRGLRKEFRGPDGMVVALGGIDLDIRDGEFCCLLGPSGCGKTTLLNILAGFVTPNAGTVAFAGNRSSEEVSRGVVFQEYALFRWRTVLGNVEFGLEMLGVPHEERQSAARKYLAKVGLQDVERAYPHQLSGGMKQRVAVARALAYDPEVLLLDEPFAALDAQTRQKLQELLADLWAESRKTVVYVTHSVPEAIYLGDRIVIFSRRPGRIKRIVDAPLPRPRDFLSDEFIVLQREVTKEIDA
jgi:NitT/TauT family transport system ATP-binding protein